MLKLTWRPRAQLDRESIAIHIALEQQNPKGSLEAIRRIDKVLDFVREFPDAGGHFIRDELEREYRTALANPYTIYYRYDEDVLTVYRILHQRQSIDTFALIPLED